MGSGLGAFGEGSPSSRGPGRAVGPGVLSELAGVPEPVGVHGGLHDLHDRLRTAVG